jgi:hypothetical protein
MHRRILNDLRKRNMTIRSNDLCKLRGVTKLMPGSWLPTLTVTKSNAASLIPALMSK